MNHHDIPGQHEADQPGEAHEPLLDADDAKEPQGAREELENHDGPRTQGEKLADDMKRMAREGAYAAAGFAGFVGEKAKEFYDDQRAQYQKAHPDAEGEPGAREFLSQLRDKLHEFVEGLTKGVQDMAERGRSQKDGADGDTGTSSVDPGSDTPAEEVPVTGSPVEDATFGGLPDDTPASDAPPADAVVVEEVVPEGSEGDAGWPDAERTDNL